MPGSFKVKYYLRPRLSQTPKFYGKQFITLEFVQMIENILQESKDKKSLIGLNYYRGEGFYCGYVLDFNDEFVVIQHFSKFGIPDGLLVHKIADIKYFEKETEYLKGIKLLLRNSIQKQTYSLPDNKELTEGFLSLFQSFIGNKEYLIKFELNDGEIYFGFVEWCDEENFSIIQVDIDGLLGKAIFRLEDIKAYWIDDLESRKRKIIYQSKNGNR
jgi:hypothetical protein